MTRSWSDHSAFRVLLVCTGNICRSAMAERLARGYLDEVLGDDVAAIQILSAGTQALVDSPMHAHSELVLRGFGAEAGDHQGQQLTAGHAAEADLTLTMTREHRHEVLELAPRAMARTFTLLEAAELLQLVDDADVVGTSLPERARALVALMARARGRRQTGRQDDVRDPISQAVEVHEEVCEAIVAALLPLLARFTSLRALPAAVSRAREDLVEAVA